LGLIYQTKILIRHSESFDYRNKYTFAAIIKNWYNR